MSTERFVKGKRLVARGPHRIVGNPDVDGIIVGMRGRLVLVQERHWPTPTPVKPDGGWFSLIVSDPAPAGFLLTKQKENA